MLLNKQKIGRESQDKGHLFMLIKRGVMNNFHAILTFVISSSSTLAAVVRAGPSPRQALLGAFCPL